MNSFLYKSTSFELADVDDKNRIIKGYGAVFGNVDSDGDIMMKGSFKRTLKNQELRPLYVAQHDVGRPLGKFMELSEDNKGLYFVAKLGTHQDGEDYYRMMKEGIIDKNSVGFRVMDYMEVEEKGRRWDITEAKLFEISAVSIPANNQASILDVKGNVDVDLVKDQYDKLARFIRKADISDELGYALEGQIYKLKALYEAATPPVEETPDPAEVKKQNEKEYLEQLHKSFYNK